MAHATGVGPAHLEGSTAFDRCPTVGQDHPAALSVAPPLLAVGNRGDIALHGGNPPLRSACTPRTRLGIAMHARIALFRGLGWFVLVNALLFELVTGWLWHQVIEPPADAPAAAYRM